jgi:cell division septum initiation protein DivIVA
MDGIFKTTMSGFKKSDVLNFIDQQEDEFKKNEKLLKDKIEELNGKIEDQGIEKEDLQSRINGLAQELELEGKASLQGQQRLLTAETESHALKKDLNKSECIIEELKLEVAVHKQDVDEKSAESAKKDAEIERLSNTISTITTTQQRISRVMVEAQNTADKIIDGAKKEAVSIISEAGKKFALMLKDAGEFKNEVDALGAKVDGFTGRLGEVSCELSDYAADIDGTGLNQTPCAKAEAPKVEKQAVEAPTDTPKSAKEPSNTGSLFNFSLGSSMFNWDKD